MKKYKGAGKHSPEELEEIIEGLLEEKHINAEQNTKDKIMLSSLGQVVSEIYESAGIENESFPDDILKNIRTYLEDFAKETKFEL